MIKGYKKVFFGMLFNTFHFNLGPIQLLPDFIAIIIICSGIKEILEVYDNNLLNASLKLFNIKMIIAIIAFILPIMGIESIFGNDMILNIIWFNIGNILELLSILKFMQGTSEVLKENFNTYLGDKYNNKTINYIYLYSILIVLANINFIFMSNTLAVITAIYGLIIRLYVILSIKPLYSESLEYN